ncbi:hypothetical protein Y032_0126g1313 [Ancylostoma ceylanicum]|uniref:Potassium channel domain-containing protein n=2 Tax=Ancylostoma ceylanicum TaxID=53326 RepID=A0A016T8J5_9BILA|nr:hypothetical protein Y032_0126g1313 [Ancylostoma ceylanicum]
MSANARSFGGTKMARKAGGLAAIMAGQPVVQHKRTIRTAIKAVFRSSGLHIGLVITCMIYIYLGAIIFRYLEHPHEIEIREETSLRFEELQQRFLRDVEEMKDTLDDDEYGFNATLDVLINNYLEELFKSFDNPIARNYFDSLFYNEGEYVDLWTMDASVLFTATTMVPVGFGLITPLTWKGRMFLVIYAIVGIPLALVTISDIGKFFCDAIFKLFRESTTIFMAALLMLLLLYPLVGGVCIHNVSHLSLFDSVYYCCITILTVGFGDIDPPIPVPYLIMFIVVGVTLVTISVDVIATNIIHQIHYMGRQMGKAKVIADKMIQMAQKISINKGLGLGMTQLGAFAKMGMMINITSNGGMLPRNHRSCDEDYKEEEEEEEQTQRKSTAFDPEVEFDLIDKLASNGYLIETWDEQENDAFYE